MELHIEPRVVKKWAQFIRENPDHSIALDGYVQGRPKFTAKGVYANFNHHEDVDRLGTRSTCAQVLIAIKQGFLESYRQGAKIDGHVFVNDPDQDTCLAYWLLENHERVQGQKSEPRISRLVYLEDMMDVTAGAYPIDPLGETMRQISWIFQPYTDARLTGRVPVMDEAEMRNVMEATCDRIGKHVLGDNSEIEPDVRYNRIGGGENWAMIEEVGAHARSKLFADGIKAFVTVRDLGDGRSVYTIGRMSPFIDFPLESFYGVLNEAEGIAKDNNDRWGGGNTIGGSPRQAGSKLKPGDIETVLNDYLKK